MSKTTTKTMKHRKITLDMLLASTSLTKSSKETSEAYLQRVTHLHLQGKKIKVIEGLELCTNLKVGETFFFFFFFSPIFFKYDLPNAMNILISYLVLTIL